MAAKPLVAIVGRPNVGKSTLFNRLVGRRKSIVTDEPGVTRDRIFGEVREGAVTFRVVDTGGLVLDREAPLAQEIERQARAALEEAAVALLVVDARAGVTGLDQEIASMLRRRALPVLPVVNKVDAPSVEPLAAAAYELGLGEPLAVSAEHGRGIDALLAAILVLLEPTLTRGDADHASAGAVRIALVGRPNVGKSSLLNRLVGEDRVMVSEVPGTTRDAVDTRLERDGRTYVVVDTAGLRRKGRVRLAADSLSMGAARRSIERADVVVVVLDASAGLVAQDVHILGYAAAARRPAVLVVNKWDLARDREGRARWWQEEVRRRMRFAKNPPIVLASAKTGQRVARILEMVDAVHAAAGIRIPTAELNRWLRDVAHRERASPARGRSVNLLYATQTGAHPPRFVLFCNDPERVHFSLRRFLDNSLRERFGFGSVPIHLRFRHRRAATER